MRLESVLLILLGLLLVLVALQGVLLLRLWQRGSRFQARLETLWQTAASTDVPTSMLVAALGRLEQRLSEAQQTPPGRSWELAQQLAREGADAEQLVARCGLSRDEANLLLKMRTINAAQ